MFRGDTGEVGRATCAYRVCRILIHTLARHVETAGRSVAPSGVAAEQGYVLSAMEHLYNELYCVRPDSDQVLLANCIPDRYPRSRMLQANMLKCFKTQLEQRVDLRSSLGHHSIWSRLILGCLFADITGASDEGPAVSRRHVSVIPRQIFGIKDAARLSSEDMHYDAMYHQKIYFPHSKPQHK